MTIATCSDLTLLRSELIGLINQSESPLATTTVAGKIKVATILQVQQGVVDTAAVTPLTLVAALESSPSNNLTNAIVNAVQTSIGADSGAQAAIATAITDEIVANISASPTYISNLNGSLPAATDTVAGKVALAIAANYPSSSDTEATTPAYVTAALADVTAALAGMYPVGSVYINASSTTNPATLLGFGTWTAFGAGRVMVGLNGSDTLFDALEETGGSKDAVVVSHTHTATVTDPTHFHTTDGTNGSNRHAVRAGTDAIIDGSSGTASTEDAFYTTGSKTGTASTGITVSNASTGSSGTNANLQPYITVAMWKRTA